MKFSPPSSLTIVGRAVLTLVSSRALRKSETHVPTSPLNFRFVTGQSNNVQSTSQNCNGRLVLEGVDFLLNSSSGALFTASTGVVIASAMSKSGKIVATLVWGTDL